MKKTDLAYAAGIFDGEGCIGIEKQVRANRRNPHYKLRATVVNTDMWLCEWLRFAFGGTVQERKSHPSHIKDQWAWVIYNSGATDFLKLILPYMNLKRPQAELAIKFQNQKNQRQGRILTPEEVAVSEAQKILMHNLKSGMPR